MAWYIWYALAYLDRASQYQKEDEMKYLGSFMVAIFFAAFGYLVWDKISAPLSEKIFTETVVGICGMIICGYTFMIADDC